MVFLSAISFLACEPPTYFGSSLLSLVKLKPKKPDALAGDFIPNRQLYRCGSVKTQRFVTCSESNATAFLFSRLLPTAWCLT